jgi:SUR7/PalI family
VILAGVTYTPPLNETFFLSADISSFHTGIDSPSGSNPPRSQLTIGFGQWTLWSVCGATTDGKNVNCGKHHPAYPFSPAENFPNSTVPIYFVQNEHFYFYTSRFMFAFYLIAITFAALSIFTSLLALCSRLGSAITSVFVSVLFPFPCTLTLGCVCFRYYSRIVDDGCFRFRP